MQLKALPQPCLLGKSCRLDFYHYILSVRYCVEICTTVTGVVDLSLLKMLDYMKNGNAVRKVECNTEFFSGISATK